MSDFRIDRAATLMFGQVKLIGDDVRFGVVKDFQFQPGHEPLPLGDLEAALASSARSVTVTFNTTLEPSITELLEQMRRKCWRADRPRRKRRRRELTRKRIRTTRMRAEALALMQFARELRP